MRTLDCLFFLVCLKIRLKKGKRVKNKKMKDLFLIINLQVFKKDLETLEYKYIIHQN